MRLIWALCVLVVWSSVIWLLFFLEFVGVGGVGMLLPAIPGWAYWVLAALGGVIASLGGTILVLLWKEKRKLTGEEKLWRDNYAQKE